MCVYLCRPCSNWPAVGTCSDSVKPPDPMADSQQALLVCLKPFFFQLSNSFSRREERNGVDYDCSARTKELQWWIEVVQKVRWRENCWYIKETPQGKIREMDLFWSHRLKSYLLNQWKKSVMEKHSLFQFYMYDITTQVKTTCFSLLRMTEKAKIQKQEMKKLICFIIVPSL